MPSLYYGTACASRNLIKGKLFDSDLDDPNRDKKCVLSKDFDLAKARAGRTFQHSYAKTFEGLQQAVMSKTTDQERLNLVSERLPPSSRAELQKAVKHDAKYKNIKPTFGSELKKINDGYKVKLAEETKANNLKPVPVILQLSNIKSDDLHITVKVGHSLMGNSKKEGRLESIICFSEEDAQLIRSAVRGQSLQVPAEARMYIQSAGQYRDLGTIVSLAK